MAMDFEDDEDWDLDLIDDLVRKEEQAIAARRSVSHSTFSSALLNTNPNPSLSLNPYPNPNLNPNPSPSLNLNPNPDRPATAVVKLPGNGLGSKESPLLLDGTSSGHFVGKSGKEALIEELQQRLRQVKNAMTQLVVFDERESWRDSISATCANYKSICLSHSFWDEVYEGMDKMIENFRGRVNDPDHWADRELSEFRRKGNYPMSISQCSEQKELERLSTQLLFKDQELLNARRACNEKTEELKKALEKIAQIRTEYEGLKRKNEDIEALPVKSSSSQLDGRTISSIPECSKPHEGKNLRSDSEVIVVSDEDPWSAPWVASQGSGMPSNAKPVQLKKVLSRDKTSPKKSAVTEIRVQTTENGCVSASHMGRNPDPDILPDLQKEPPSRRGNPLIEENVASVKKHGGSYSKLHQGLHQIWSYESAKQDGLGLVAKLLAACDTDLCNLLRGGSCLTEKEAEQADFTTTSCKEEDTILAMKLQSVFSQLANGLTSPWSLLLLLLEYGSSKNDNVIRSALRVLRYVLLHNLECRYKVRTRQPFSNQRIGFGVDKIMADLGNRGLESLQNINFLLKGKLSDGKVEEIPDMQLFSPRVFCKKENSVSEERYPLCEANLDRKEPEETSAKQLGISDACNNTFEMENNQVFRCVFELVQKATSLEVKVEAIAILNLLVMQTEPVNERERFSSILFDGNITNILSKSTSLDVQLQAVRLVHLLLHCPSVFRKLFFGKEEMTEKDESYVVSVDQEGKANGVETGSKGLKAINLRMKLLHGLTTCLHADSYSLQEYVLRRSALRVLAFIASSGHQVVLSFVGLRSMVPEVDETKNGNAYNDNGKWEEINVPKQLFHLLDNELEAEETNDGATCPKDLSTERSCLIRETLTILCRLASHPSQSSAFLLALKEDKTTARLAICVTNRLVGRRLSEGCNISLSKSMSKGKLVSLADSVELAKGLRRTILTCLHTE